RFVARTRVGPSRAWGTPFGGPTYPLGCYPCPCTTCNRCPCTAQSSHHGHHLEVRRPRTVLRPAQDRRRPPPSPRRGPRAALAGAGRGGSDISRLPLLTHLFHQSRARR